MTLDLDFADVTRFPPDRSKGIVVLRLPRNPTLALLEQLIRQFLEASTRMAPEGKLWIVETGRVRIHESRVSAAGE